MLLFCIDYQICQLILQSSLLLTITRVIIIMEQAPTCLQVIDLLLYIHFSDIDIFTLIANRLKCKMSFPALFINLYYLANINFSSC